jgi:anti-anti-sigma factor
MGVNVTPVNEACDELVRWKTNSNGPTRVWLTGEHDSSTARALWQSLAAAIAVNQADLVVDLSEVKFMDAAIVRVLIRARECLDQQSRKLVLQAPSRRAWRVLELCGLTAMVEPGDDRPAA